MACGGEPVEGRQVAQKRARDEEEQQIERTPHLGRSMIHFQI